MVESLLGTKLQGAPVTPHSGASCKLSPQNTERHIRAANQHSPNPKKGPLSIQHNDLTPNHHRPIGIPNSLLLSRHQQDAVTNRSAVQGVGKIALAGRRRVISIEQRRAPSTARPMPLLRDRPGRCRRPEACLWRAQGPGPYLPEPLRPLPARP